MKAKQNLQQGYVALMAVLIVGAASIAVASSLLLTSTDAQRSVLTLQSSMKARQHAVACAEEALEVIHGNTTYTGSNSLTLTTGTCNYTVTNTGGSNRTITANSTVGTAIRKLQITVTIGASISITSWQEVS